MGQGPGEAWPDCTPEEAVAAVKAIRAERSEAVPKERSVPITENGQSGLIWLRDKESGRLERDVVGPTNWRHVPTSPYYEFTPGYWMNARAWLEPDGRHVHVAHDCRGVRESHTLPWPVWQALPDGRVDPSYNCDRCGVHTFLTLRWEVVDIAAEVAERRTDKGFMDRIRDRVKRDKALLGRIAEGPDDV